MELREIPAPGRGVAPHGLAFEAELLPDPVVSGRFVVLHDPAGQPAWGSTTRVIVLVQGEIDEVTSSDPLLPASRRYGEPEDKGGQDGPECDVELRASWSPGEAMDLLPHLEAFCNLLGAVAGIPPPVTGLLTPVTGLPDR